MFYLFFYQKSVSLRKSKNKKTTTKTKTNKQKIYVFAIFFSKQARKMFIDIYLIFGCCVFSFFHSFDEF